MTDYAVYFEDPQRANFLSKVISAIFMSSQSILSIHALTHMHSHIHVLTHTHVLSHTLTHTCTHTHALTHMHSHTHVLTHTHIHALTHTRTHSHTRTTCPHYLQTPLCKYTYFLKFTCAPQISTRGTLPVFCGHAICCHQCAYSK